MKEKNIEELAARLHTVYQAEAYRQGDVRHVDRYEELPECAKDFDRALARWIAENFVEREKVEKVMRLKVKFSPERDPEQRVFRCGLEEDYQALRRSE